MDVDVVWLAEEWEGGQMSRGPREILEIGY